jgi:Putative zinc-finger
VARRGSKQDGPRLSHRSVRAHMMDYHFGRLSPEMNAAIEQHVRSCETCRAEGMTHLASEKRAAVRLGRAGSGGSTGGLPRIIALIATLLLLALLLYVLLSTFDHSLPPAVP